MYEPSGEEGFGHKRHEKFCIDDYRSPVCAAIGLSYRFGIEKLAMVCCDDSFDYGKEGAVKLHNGLWTYPNHVENFEIIDTNLYWLTRQENKNVAVADWSGGIKYKNATYINELEQLKGFSMKTFSEFMNQVGQTPAIQPIVGAQTWDMNKKVGYVADVASKGLGLDLSKLPLAIQNMLKQRNPGPAPQTPQQPATPATPNTQQNPLAQGGMNRGT